MNGLLRSRMASQAIVAMAMFAAIAVALRAYGAAPGWILRAYLLAFAVTVFWSVLRWLIEQAPRRAADGVQGLSDDRPDELRHVERIVRLSQAAEFDFYTRLRPRLVAIALRRETKRGDRAGLMLAESGLLRERDLPGLDRTGHGVKLSAIRELVDDLEGPN